MRFTFAEPSVERSRSTRLSPLLVSLNSAAPALRNDPQQPRTPIAALSHQRGHGVASAASETGRGAAGAAGAAVACATDPGVSGDEQAATDQADTGPSPVRDVGGVGAGVRGALPPVCTVSTASAAGCRGAADLRRNFTQRYGYPAASRRAHRHVGRLAADGRVRPQSQVPIRPGHHPSGVCGGAGSASRVPGHGGARRAGREDVLEAIRRDAHRGVERCGCADVLCAVRAGRRGRRGGARRGRGQSTVGSTADGGESGCNPVAMDMRSEEHRSAALELAHRFNRHGKLVVEAYLPQRTDAEAALDTVVLDELRSDGRPDSTADAAAAATAAILQNPLRSSASTRTSAANTPSSSCTTRAAVQAAAQALREYGEQVERAGDAV
eukprot:ctg_544.g309